MLSHYRPVPPTLLQPHKKVLTESIFKKSNDSTYIYTYIHILILKFCSFFLPSNSEKAHSRSKRPTNATWELSMHWTSIPFSEQSKFTSLHLKVEVTMQRWLKLGHKNQRMAAISVPLVYNNTLPSIWMDTLINISETCEHRDLLEILLGWKGNERDLPSRVRFYSRISCVNWGIIPEPQASMC